MSEQQVCCVKSELGCGWENKAAKHKLIEAKAVSKLFHPYPASSASATECNGLKISNHFISAMQINKNDRYMHDCYSEIEFSSELELSAFFNENVKQPAFPQGTDLKFSSLRAVGRMHLRLNFKIIFYCLRFKRKVKVTF
jgi:hypothetical protein